MLARSSSGWQSLAFLLTTFFGVTVLATPTAHSQPQETPSPLPAVSTLISPVVLPPLDRPRPSIEPPRLGLAEQGIAPVGLQATPNNPTNPQVGAFPGGQIRLQWQDNSGDEQGFRIERTTGISGTAWSQIVTVPANTTTYTDTPGILNESFWYRVRAYNAQGNSDYSNASFNSTFASAPNRSEEHTSE